MQQSIGGVGDGSSFVLRSARSGEGKMRSGGIQQETRGCTANGKGKTGVEPEKWSSDGPVIV